MKTFHSLFSKGMYLGCMLLCFSCGTKQVQRYICTCGQREKVQEFVERSIKPANNMSDEEMEDVILALYRTGVSLNCELRTIEVESITPFIPITKLDSCEFFME